MADWSRKQLLFKIVQRFLKQVHRHANVLYGELDQSLRERYERNDGWIFGETSPMKLQRQGKVYTTEGQIGDIVFDTCRFESLGGGHIRNFGTHRPKELTFRDCTFRKTENPDPGMFKPGPETLLVEGADDVIFRHCRILDAAPGAFIARDVTGLVTEECDFQRKPTHGVCLDICGKR